MTEENLGPYVDEWKPRQRLHPTQILVGGAVLFIVFAIAIVALAKGSPDDYWPNIASELASIAFTVLILDRLNHLRLHEERKRELIEQLGSPVNNAALEALRIIRKHGWGGDGSLHGADLRHANLQNADLVGFNLQGVDLDHSNLQEVDLRGANLQNASLWRVNLQYAKLIGTHLQDAYLMEANLLGAVLQGANLLNAELEGANMQSTELDDANLQYASLGGANLRGADLGKANLQGAFLPGTIFTDAIYDDGIQWPNDTVPEGAWNWDKMSLSEEVSWLEKWRR